MSGKEPACKVHIAAEFRDWLKKRFPVVHHLGAGWLHRCCSEGSEEGAVKRGAVRRGMGKMMVMILELRKRLEDNQCQLMYNVQWMTEFSRTRFS